MPIFFSHRHTDNQLVSMYAKKVGAKIGTENVFLDLWQDTPGESIIEFMDDGIGKSSHFVLFWSAAAAQSLAVKDEWQAALMKAYKDEIKFVLMRLDDYPVPTILQHRFYIDHRDGVEACLIKLVRFYRNELKHSEVIVARDLYYEVTFEEDDSITFEVFSLSNHSEIGPFGVLSDVHHSYLQFGKSNGRDFQALVGEEGYLDGRSMFMVAFKFFDGGVTQARPAKMRLRKIKSCAPLLSRLHVKRQDGWRPLPLNKVTDRTAA